MDVLEPWKRIEEKDYVHSPHRAIVDVRFELPDGREETFSLKKEGKVVSVLALTRDMSVLLTRQYRPGPDRVLDELPSGGVSKDESCYEAAERELLEETGYRCEELIHLGCPLECAYSTIERHAFLANGCEKISDQQLDKNEFIQVILKPVPSFVDQLKRGDLTDPEVGWMGLFKLGIINIAV